MLRNHGQDGVHRFLHHEIGYNSRFDEVIAAFQLHRLPTFADRLERRAQIADYYSERFTPLRDRGRARAARRAERTLLLRLLPARASGATTCART